MVGIGVHYIRPAVRHLEAPLPKIKIEAARVTSYLAINPFFELLKSRGNRLQAIRGRIGSEAVLIVFFRPFHAAHVEIREVFDFAQQLRIQCARRALARKNKRGELF